MQHNLILSTIIFVNIIKKVSVQKTHISRQNYRKFYNMKETKTKVVDILAVYLYELAPFGTVKFTNIMVFKSIKSCYIFDFIGNS